MIGRGRFLALLSGGTLGSVVPKIVEAEEEFEAQGVGEISFQQQSKFHDPTSTVTPQYETTGVTVELSWSKDGHLWFIHSNGTQKKLI